jgi:predicted enzyme related to lactoylglutathione lyase
MPKANITGNTSRELITNIRVLGELIKKANMQATRVLLSAVLTLLLAFVATGAEWDHVHLTAANPPKAADWYAKHFGGERTESGPFPAVLFGKNVVKFKPGADGYGKSVGSAVDHIGFSVEDVAGTMQALEADGATITNEPRTVPAAGFTFGFVEDPWGTRIELIDDAETPGFHHVHVTAEDVPNALEWYKTAFGGEIVPFKGFAPVRGIKYGDTWLLVMGARETPEPIAGRAIEHLGWRVPDIAAFEKQLETVGGKFVIGPQKNPEGFMFGFMETPGGVKIEIIESAEAK